MGLTQSNAKYTYKNEAKRDSTGSRREGNVTTEAEIGAVRPQTKECGQPPDAGTGSSVTFTWCSPADTLILDFWPSEL